MSKHGGIIIVFGLLISLSGESKTPSSSKSKSLESKSRATLVCTKGPEEKLFCSPIETNDVEFNSTNLVVLNGAIDSQSASAFVKSFLTLEHRDETQRIYVYISSPGGSIFAGDAISNVIRSSKKEVVVIINFAASMAFHISQYATRRLILPTGTMMQHHASGSPQAGPFPNVEKEWSWLKRKVATMNKKDSSGCSKTSHDEFMKNIDRDWWLLSEEAVAAGCVDGIVSHLTCSKELSDRIVTTSASVMGMEINLQWSGCPLESYPRKVEIKMPGSKSSTSTSSNEITAEQQTAVDAYLLLTTDPLQFYNLHGSFSEAK